MNRDDGRHAPRHPAPSDPGFSLWVSGVPAPVLAPVAVDVFDVCVSVLTG